jgi:hypothetical protein
MQTARGHGQSAPPLPPHLHALDHFSWRVGLRQVLQVHLGHQMTKVCGAQGSGRVR